MKTNKVKIKTQWDLSCFYRDENDPKIEKEIGAIESANSKFEKKYKNKDFTKSSKTLLSALDDYLDLFEVSERSHAMRYFAFRFDLNSEDSVAQAMITKIGNRLTLSQNKTTFFGVELSKIPKSKQIVFLKDRKLEFYNYFLRNIFNNAKYVLTEKEEQMTDLLGNTSYSLWVEGQEKLLSGQTVSFKGENLPIQKAISMIPELPKKDRYLLHGKVSEVLKSISHFAEAEINAVYNFKKVMDERRGYRKPYSASVLAYQNDEKTIENLVSMVTKYFRVSKRFYKLHARILGIKKLSVSDRAVKLGQIKRKFDFEESVEIVGEIFKKIGPKYNDIFCSLLENGKVDVYPKKSKRGGAYCAPVHNMPTMIFLNHTNDLNSLETLAHEMGHAIHTELSKKQSLLYRDYPMSSAEVASTFFEQVVIGEIESQLTDKEKTILLHTKLVSDVATIFRQIACFNFELELHKRIRAEGQISKFEIAKLLKKHLESYMGEAFEVKIDDGYFFVPWSHIRRFFYVYSYAYGQIISRAFYENWKKDPKYIEKIHRFLSAGGSKSPKNIFRDCGIDINDPKFFEDGLKSIEKDVRRLEKLVSSKSGIIKPSNNKLNK